MQMPTLKHTMMIIYDGIKNSVFDSLVLAPLLSDLEKDPALSITLVSFERNYPTEKGAKLSTMHPRLSLVFFKKPPFMGRWVLRLGAWQLCSLLKQKKYSHIMARGPLAGWIALKATRTIPITIQARGLCAQEHRYATQDQSAHLLKTWKNRTTYRQLYAVESGVFGSNHKNIMFESVSPALKDYMVKTFDTKPEMVSIATRDLPAFPGQEQIAQWRNQIRSALDIASHAYVYCYSGSYKPWQCADETIEYFIDCYEKNKNAFLLILTPDITPFTKALEKYNLPAPSYAILNAPASLLFQYLAAADAGFLFRQPDIINWVSRPTKMLEYQAVGLEIIHNSTIAWLVNENVVLDKKIS
jgi:hypothetical protein